MKIAYTLSGIILTGSAFDADSGQWMVAQRLTPSGLVDKTFGIGGTTLVPITGYHDGVATSMATSTSGVLIAGSAVRDGSNNRDFVVARLAWNGKLDATFGDPAMSGRRVIAFGKGGSNGDSAVSIRTTSTGQLISHLSSMVRLNGDGIVLVGTAYDATNKGDIAVLKLTADGSVDTPFGESGTQMMPSFMENDEGIELGRTVSIAGDGEHVLVGGTVQVDLNHPGNRDVVITSLNLYY